MADEMLRVAGRGSDGLAKAIKTDVDGKIQIDDAAVSQITLELVAVELVQSAVFDVSKIVGITNEGDFVLNISFDNISWFSIKPHAIGFQDVSIKISKFYYSSEKPTNFKIQGVKK